ncbi:hypothetical protein L2E82_02099 [Cichorium intybus]|uniref:Uncharacterized protein n=1 Tax=Cichorium intybus TaxID=13427 RepID=A0ACB9H1D3_CICIN|nr:hypothetical protein L2E82_02099 [Cichorium intybus]
MTFLSCLPYRITGETNSRLSVMDDDDREDANGSSESTTGETDELYLNRNTEVSFIRRLEDLAASDLESTDVVLWTSMLGVYGKNGHHKEVIQLFQEMSTKKVKPEGVAFVTVISSCGHTG